MLIFAVCSSAKQKGISYKIEKETLGDDAYYLIYSSSTKEILADLQAW